LGRAREIAQELRHESNASIPPDPDVDVLGWSACFDAALQTTNLIVTSSTALEVVRQLELNQDANNLLRQVPFVGVITLIWNPGISKLRVFLCHLIRDIFGNPLHPTAVDPTWLTTNVVALAQAIYDERAFERMPILADALEDAGCTNDVVLAHCRGPGPHARGCWVVDLLLGKE
jgi:hypothetical protein